MQGRTYLSDVFRCLLTLLSAQVSAVCKSPCANNFPMNSFEIYAHRSSLQMNWIWAAPAVCVTGGGKHHTSSIQDQRLFFLPSEAWIKETALAATLNSLFKIRLPPHPTPKFHSIQYFPKKHLKFHLCLSLEKSNQFHLPNTTFPFIDFHLKGNFFRNGHSFKRTCYKKPA